MPSSTSSSDPRGADVAALPGTARIASEASYRRPLPALRHGVALSVALLVFVAGLAAWEGHWRAFGAEPSYVNSDHLWAMQRRRIDQGEGDATVIIGSSRVLFDLQLPVWERLAGERPIQLALEGSTPLFVLEDLAADPDFTGRLIVGVTPPLFFTGFARRAAVLEHYRKETPAQRAGQWLSMHLLEPWLAFLDPDFALFTVLERQPWPPRTGVASLPEVRKLSVSGPDRATHMWRKLEQDPDYQRIAQETWRALFSRPPPGDPAKMPQLIGAQIDRATAAVQTLRARGVDVIFVRPPSTGFFLDFEERAFPRAATWDVLIARSGARGIHFADHPEMQGLELPEWSHLSRASAERYTEALYRAIVAGERAAPSEADADNMPGQSTPSPAGRPDTLF